MLLPKKIRWTHHYGFRCGEWTTVLTIENYTPNGLSTREVYKVEYDDGIIDYIPTSEHKHLEFQY